MQRFLGSRTTTLGAVTVVVALVGAGCGPLADPVYATSDEVLDALLALQEGAEVRATAELTVDQGELRAALRDDPEALALFQEALDDADVEDVDDLLAELEQAQARLADHAVLLATGADGSARIAAEHRGTAWADLRVGSGPGAGGDPAEGIRVDLQLQVDWATAATVFDQPDLFGDLDEAAAEIAPFLGESPDLEPVQRLVVAFLGGELVGISGEVGPDLLSALGMGEDGLAGATEPGGVFGLGGDGVLDLGMRELAETAFTFDGFRRDGATTLVDVTVEVGAAAELLLDELAEAPDAMGMSFEDVEEARAELDRLPDRLVDVAVLRFGGDGVLQQVRVDVVDVALQVARAADPGDEDVATVERLAGQLDATGLFVLFDVEGVGTTATVLGDPTTTVTPQELAGGFGALFLGGLGQLDGFEEFDELSEPAGSDVLGGDSSHGEDGTDFSTSGGSAFAPGLHPDQLAVGDCFDDTVLFGFETADPTVPCDGPHDNEAFAIVVTDVATYDDLTRNESDAVACIEDEFEPYVGVSYAESELIVDVLRPTREQFEAGARASVCYLYGFEPLTGSAAGTGI